MKNDIVKYVAKCLECQRVKAEHRHSARLLRLHDVPQHKWKFISMDFVQGFTMSPSRHDTIMVVIDKLTKVAYFISRNLSDDAPTFARRFVKAIFRLHGMLEKIISHRDARFTSRFWTTLQSTLRTRLNFSTAYHPKTDGQTKRTNQILEDLLRMYCMDQ